MTGDRLNTAEHDAKGRCVRHPDVRLRKKKLLGGWKIVIGHCPECCLDEMRRVRDEIEEKHMDSKGKKKKKKSKEGRRKKVSSNISDDGSDDSPRDSNANQYGKEDESEATGSTEQMDSMNGNDTGSVVSEQHIRPNYFPPPVSRPPPPMHQPERTMVLSMSFTDPRTGHRGTYTGQVNSINHKPDGKGTVYYADGSIAEGSWANGILVDTDATDGRYYEDDQAVPQNDYSYSSGNATSSGRGSRPTSNPRPPPRRSPKPPPQSVLRGRTPVRPRQMSFGGDDYGNSDDYSHGDRSRGEDRPEPDYRNPYIRSRSRSNSREPPGHSAPNTRASMQVSETGSTGNLHRLESLAGRRQSASGSSASVSSHGSRSRRDWSASKSVQFHHAAVNNDRAYERHEPPDRDDDLDYQPMQQYPAPPPGSRRVSRDC